MADGLVEVDNIRNMIIGLVLVVFAIICIRTNFFSSIPGYNMILQMVPILGLLAIIFVLNIPY
jgi:hypothetical protein